MKYITQIRSGGEVHLEIPNAMYHDHHYSPSNSDEVMEMLLAIDSLKPYEINIGYLPYARADRSIHKITGPAMVTEPNGCVTALRLLRAVAPNARITVLDAHNPRILEAFDIHSRYAFFDIRDDGKTVVISPDAGAADRAKYYAGTYGVPVVQCHKSRDASGAPTVVIPPYNLQGCTALIVDDILDGGRTFVDLARKLKEAGAARVKLQVTFGIFSNGYNLPYIDEIYTTDACPGAAKIAGTREDIFVQKWH